MGRQPAIQVFKSVDDPVMTGLDRSSIFGTREYIELVRFNGIDNRRSVVKPSSRSVEIAV
jgi:hypothetical protein